MNDKKKNLLDLEYNTYLTYLQIIIVLIGTSFLTLVLGTLPRWTPKNLVVTIIVTISIIAVTWMGFYTKLKDIRRDIQELQ